MSFLKSLFGGGGWKSMPPAVSADLRQRLGQTRFDAFTRICQRHGVFSQMSQVVGTTGYDAEVGATMLAVFLTSVGNELGRQGVMRQDSSFSQDALQVFDVILELKPDHFAARMSLATTCLALGKTERAQSEAALAVQGIDKSLATGVPQDLPPEFSMPEAELKKMRDMMQTIAEGREL